MRLLGTVLFCLAASLTGCLSSTTPPLPIRPATPAVQVSKAQLSSDAAQQIVKDGFRGSQIESSKAELRTFDWISANMGVQQSLYTPDSVAWVVTVTGKLSNTGIKGDGSQASSKYNSVTAIVSADNGTILASQNTPNN